MSLKFVASGGLAALALLAGPAMGQTPALRQGFDIRAGAPPAPVRIGDRTRLVYELQLSNFASTALEESRIEAIDGATGRVLADLQGPALDAALGGSRTVPAGGFVMAFLEVPVDGRRPIACAIG